MKLKQLSIPWRNFFIFCAVFLVFCGVITPFIQKSFWLDEGLTHWAINDSVPHIWSKTLKWLGQSPLYYICLKLWSEYAGNSEISLRGFSLLFIFATAYMVFQCSFLLSRSQKGALLSVSVFLFYPPFIREALSARPYIFAYFFSVLATYIFLRIIRQSHETCSMCWYFFYSVACALTIYGHYFFSLVIFSHFLFLLFQWPVYQSRMKRFFYSYFFSVVLTFPLLSQMISLTTQKEKVFALSDPDWFDILDAFLPPIQGILLLLSIAHCYWVQKGRKSYIDGYAAFCILVWIIPPLGILILSKITGLNVFIVHYYGFQYLGFALLVGMLFSQVTYRVGMSLVFLITGILFPLQSIGMNFIEEDFRSAIQDINETPQALVLFFSGHIEAADLSYVIQEEKREILMSMTIPYPIHHRAILLPILGDPQWQGFFDAYISSATQANHTVYLLGRTMPDWIVVQVKQSLDVVGFQKDEKASHYGEIVVERFQKIPA